ncbi:Orotate phosphoribosyltransferase [Smittium mucronatum]|uniref:orotate phosphoribosyltransferase n=1 Tax=Smittium mucronatum TaxID=133383 RepID=A0A1R0H257_9FUNG|nr:Orotate phosphoribosyltransferase [Smittium mucronatum]
MLATEKEFIEAAIEHKVLSFGSFTLKSGRQSPYFFNAGNFNTGQSLATICRLYAKTVLDSGIEFDVIFGPAYKGIPLAAGVSIALSQLDPSRPFAFAYDRKEAKTHGEGGSLVGSPIAGKRILLIDDVITAGTAISNSFRLISEAGGIPVGVVVAIDRQEIANPDSAADSAPPASAIQQVFSKYGIPVFPIVKLDTIIEYLASTDSEYKAFLPEIKTYRQKYAC